MALKVELKPGEKLIVGTCVITNSDQRTKLFIDGKAPILREKDILSPTTADTPAKAIYLAARHEAAVKVHLPLSNIRRPERQTDATFHSRAGNPINQVEDKGVTFDMAVTRPKFSSHHPNRICALGTQASRRRHWMEIQLLDGGKDSLPGHLFYKRTVIEYIRDCTH